MHRDTLPPTATSGVSPRVVHSQVPTSTCALGGAAAWLIFYLLARPSFKYLWDPLFDGVRPDLAIYQLCAVAIASVAPVSAVLARLCRGMWLYKWALFAAGMVVCAVLNSHAYGMTSRQAVLVLTRSVFVTSLVASFIAFLVLERS